MNINKEDTMPQFPSKEAQKKFYEDQIEELAKINLQNEYTRLRNVKRLEIAKEEKDLATEAAVQAELDKVEREFKSSELYIAVANEELAKL